MKSQSARQDEQEKMPPSETSLAMQVRVGQSTYLLITNQKIRYHQGRRPLPLYHYKQCCFAGMHVMKQPCNKAGQAPNDCVSCAAAPCTKQPTLQASTSPKEQNILR